MIVEVYENNTYDGGVARVHRRPGSIASIRRRRAADSFRTALHACETRTSLQEKSCGESESTRTQAQGQALDLGPRFPRHGLVDGFRFPHLTGEFRVSQPFADDLTYTDVETLRISHLAIIETKHLFIYVAKQVEWLHADIGAVQLPFNEAPKIFHPVSVGIFIRVLDGVIDNGVLVILGQPIIGKQFVSEDRRARFDVLPYLALKFALAAILYDHRAHVAAAFQHSHNDSLVLSAGSGNDSLTLCLVHVAGLAANESLIDLNTTVATQLAALLSLLSEPDSMEHEPSGFLSNSQRPMNLARTDTVLAIENHPHCGKPLIKANRRLLKDGTDLDRELPLSVPVAALPAQLVLEEADLIATTDGADNAVLPFGTAKHKVFQAVFRIREVQDRFLQGLWFVDRFHDSIVSRQRVLVKYIFALRSAAPPSRSSTRMNVCCMSPQVSSLGTMPSINLQVI